MNILFGIVMALPMVLAGIFGMWALFIVFTTFNVIFGLTEWLMKVKTGKTVSQQVWAWKKEHPVKAMIIIVSMILMWLSLCGHLVMHK